MSNTRSIVIEKEYNRARIALYRIWTIIEEATKWQHYSQKFIRITHEPGYASTARNADQFVGFYHAKIANHKWRNGCFVLTLNFRDKWGVVHSKRQWAFLKDGTVLESYEKG